ncbi:MAG: phosphoribosyltransferase [Synechococcales bacterium]|nr:phosphoribosyltransferase [Synechococcales bacterium]
MIFHDRIDAGQQLARQLRPYANRPEVIVLGLPRGGVPVAAEVATALKAPLDVLVVRKLGVPGAKEMAMGAIASGSVRYLNRPLIQQLKISPSEVESVTLQEEQELSRREKAYRNGRPPLDVQDRIAILVDDGLATGATMRAAIQALQQHHPKGIVVAVPVAAAEICEQFRQQVDAVVCAETPDPFRAVGLWYEQFPQTSDDEVRTLLRRSLGQMLNSPAATDGAFAGPS